MGRGVVKEILTGIETMSSTLQQILSRMEKQEERADALERRVQQQSEEMKALSEEVRGLREEKSEWRAQYDEVRERLIDQEARARRNNILIHGVEEGGQGEDVVRVVKELIGRRMKVEGDVIIERAHRIGGRRQGPGKPRPVIVKFLQYQQREKVRAARRHLPAGIHITEDLPFEIREARKQLVPKMMRFREERKEAWITYPARLIVDGKLQETISPASMATRSSRQGAGGQDGGQNKGGRS